MGNDDSLHGNQTDTGSNSLYPRQAIHTKVSGRRIRPVLRLKGIPSEISRGVGTRDARITRTCSMPKVYDKTRHDHGERGKV